MRAMIGYFVYNETGEGGFGRQNCVLSLKFISAAHLFRWLIRRSTALLEIKLLVAGGFGLLAFVFTASVGVVICNLRAK